MNKEQKTQAIADLKDQFENNPFFYLTDTSGLTVAQVNKLRRICFEKNVSMQVVKNTLVKKALESIEDKGFEGLYDSLKGPTAIMFAAVANEPAKLINDFRKTKPKPILKAAYIDFDVYIGDDQLDALKALKSKEELLGEIISLLQSPAKNVISALKSGGSTIAGLVKALEERAAN